DGRPFDEDFAIIGDLDIQVCQHTTYCAKFDIGFCPGVDSHDRRGLCQAIAFQYLDVCCPEYPRKTLLQGCATRNNEFYMASQCIFPFGEDQLTGDGQLKVIPATV